MVDGMSLRCVPLSLLPSEADTVSVWKVLGLIQVSSNDPVTMMTTISTFTRWNRYRLRVSTRAMHPHYRLENNLRCVSCFEATELSNLLSSYFFSLSCVRFLFDCGATSKLKCRDITERLTHLRASHDRCLSSYGDQLPSPTGFLSTCCAIS